MRLSRYSPAVVNLKPLNDPAFDLLTTGQRIAVAELARRQAPPPMAYATAYVASHVRLGINAHATIFAAVMVRIAVLTVPAILNVARRTAAGALAFVVLAVARRERSEVCLCGLVHPHPLSLLLPSPHHPPLVLLNLAVLSQQFIVFLGHRLHHGVANPAE